MKYCHILPPRLIHLNGKIFSLFESNSLLHYHKVTFCEAFPKCSGLYFLFTYSYPCSSSTTT